ncbi:MAG TPA: LptA/OstA family protein [Steroidobacteraceae bacterium]|jgi:lipopolysaccharide transport protein LptA
MANSTGISLTWRPAAALPLILLGGMAQAAAVSCQNQEIVIDARPGMEVDYRNNNAVLRDVVITQCDMRIQAEEARVVGGLNFESGQLTVTGDVRIAAEGGNLSSDKAVISFRDRLITRATITGSPAQFEQKRDDGSTSRGRAGTIDYLAADGTVSFSDEAWITPDGKNQISGRAFVYNIRLQRMEGQPKSATTEKSGKDRIRIVIPAPDPGEKEEEKKQ